MFRASSRGQAWSLSNQLVGNNTHSWTASKERVKAHLQTTGSTAGVTHDALAMIREGSNIADDVVHINLDNHGWLEKRKRAAEILSRLDWSTQLFVLFVTKKAQMTHLNFKIQWSFANVLQFCTWMSQGCLSS